MNTPITNQNETTKPRLSARKQIPSILDPFTEPLLRMDDEKKTIHEIVTWLKTQGIETSGPNVSKFLTKRRAKRQYDGEKSPIEAFQEWIAENPNATLEAVIERFKMLALSLSLKQEAAPEVLKLADRLAGTASRVANDQSRADYRARKLFMEEQKHAEWIKCEQTRALELCLGEAKKNPEVVGLFRKAFNALKAVNSPVLWRKDDGPQPMPASCVKATSPWKEPANLL
jgi:hypothetical protein